jgi:YesN/AraC family two-component response regulator
MLAFNGCMVAEAGGVAEAIQQFEWERADVVVTDLCLPDGSGLELLSHLRAVDSKFSAIVATGFGSFDQAVEAIRLRTAAFLTKPFSPSELLRVIRETQPGAQTQDSFEAGRAPANAQGARSLLAKLEHQLSKIGVPGTVATRALSLAGEAIQNCVRHAYPSRPGIVALEAAEEDGSLVIRVRDEGIGFDLAEAVGHRAEGAGEPGLIRLHREADEARVSSEAGRGTEVYLRFRICKENQTQQFEPAGDDGLAVALLWS